MRVLLVEDEPQLREQLKQELTAAGYAVDTAADGREALVIGKEYPFDLAIVDLGLPLLSGIDVIKGWRAAGKTLPVLILTARGRWQDKVDGLNAGADDYVVKPFQFEEILARAKALLRRAAGVAQPKVQFGALELDTSSQVVTVDGKPVELTAHEYKLLEFLALNTGKVISKTELTEHIYDQDFDRDSNVIEVFVGRLRRKLDPKNRLQPIETLRGRGYRFRLDRST